jgi:ABC-type Zn2+ transport system substrate-binding protein/surface adhesin
MIRLVSFLFSLLILSQSLNSYIGTLGEVNTLLKHAKVHSEEYGDNFIVFLSKHYGDSKEQHSHDDQEKDEDHEKLPFTHHCSSQTLVTLNPEVTGLALFKPLPAADSTCNFGYTNLYSSIEVSSIFQPPRLS